MMAELAGLAVLGCWLYAKHERRAARRREMAKALMPHVFTPRRKT